MKTMGSFFYILISFLFFSLTVSSSFAAIKMNRAAPEPVRAQQKFDDQFYLKSARSALKQFQVDTFKNSDLDLDLIFLKIEKKVVYQDVKPHQSIYFEFQNLTNSVVQFVGLLKDSYKLPVDAKLRSNMQMNFYGLSQAIKKANQMNLTIQSEQFEKLHDILMSQSTNLFYASYKERRRADLFWCAYFLHELNYPMDLTAKHISALESSIAKLNQPEKYKLYGAKLAKLSLTLGDQLSKPTQDHIDILYKWAQYDSLTDTEFQLVQKSYLKQLQVIGDSEKIKDFKKELATSLLYRESKNVFHHPLNVFKYIQFIIGYIFVAWPLEVILIIGSLLIFGFQASTVLNAEEKRKAKRLDKKLWMMFTKSYLGANVPFFSKLAASLILFGVGLYFNSAKNFVESLISNL